MIINHPARNQILITLTDDEVETYNYMNELSALLFTEHVQNLFINRKRQQEEDMRIQLTRNMTREQLREELSRRNNG
jgi:hypothetical protein